MKENSKMKRNTKKNKELARVSTAVLAGVMLTGSALSYVEAATIDENEPSTSLDQDNQETTPLTQQEAETNYETAKQNLQDARNAESEAIRQ